MNWQGATPKTQLATLPNMDKEIFTERSDKVSIFPSFALACTQQAFYLFQVLPLTTDSCQYTYAIYGSDWGNELKPKEWDAIINAMDGLAEEDILTMASIQKSMATDPGKGVLLGSQEVLLYNFNAEIDRRIGADKIPANLRVSDALRNFVVA